jgi:GNAT superfamily N-acetyltransferase
MDGARMIELPDGLTFRGATHDDIDMITELAAMCELDADGVADVDRDDFVSGFGRMGFDPAVDMLLVFDGDVPVAWAEVYRGRAEADVMPSHRGRGLGVILRTWTEERARALGLREVGQTKTDADAAAKALFLSNGYGPTYTSWMIRKPLDGLQARPEVPHGIEIRPYEDRDARAAHRVIDAAFCEWPGRDPDPFESWVNVVRHPAFAPELSPLAFEADELVGVLLAYDYPEVGEGWVQQLATEANHRHRGIAMAMLRTAFGAFRERGRSRAGVSTDSRTGALDLYEKLGMRVERSYTRYTKRLT